MVTVALTVAADAKKKTSSARDDLHSVVDCQLPTGRQRNMDIKERPLKPQRMKGGHQSSNQSRKEGRACTEHTRGAAQLKQSQKYLKIIFIQNWYIMVYTGDTIGIYKSNCIRGRLSGLLCRPASLGSLLGNLSYILGSRSKKVLCITPFVWSVHQSDLCYQTFFATDVYLGSAELGCDLK